MGGCLPSWGDPCALPVPRGSAPRPAQPRGGLGVGAGSVPREPGWGPKFRRLPTPQAWSCWVLSQGFKPKSQTSGRLCPGGLLPTHTYTPV